MIARVDLAHEANFALGGIEVRPARRELVGKGFREIIDPRVMRVLVALARAKGEILSRDDLIESCWDGVIVGDDAINRCISRLRAAAEASGNAFSIETIPRVGYRLHAPRIAPAIGGAPATPAETSVLTPSTAASAISPMQRRWMIASIPTAVLLVLILAGLAAWRLWPRPLPAELGAPANSVAVLPFANMSGDAKQNYFSDGFSEELLNELSSNPNLRVPGYTSSSSFKGTSTELKSVAHQLGVRAIAEGSIREVGNRLRVDAQLINASDGYVIWSGNYERGMTDILTVQDDIAHAIATSLTHKLIPAAPRRKIDPAVYRMYLQAIADYEQFSLGSDRKAFDLLKTVTARQPDFADGFAELSTVADSLTGYDPAHASYYRSLSFETAQKALAIDPRNIDALSQRAVLALSVWNWRAAASDNLALASAHPNNVSVLRGLRLFYAWMGLDDESLSVIRRAQTLDPASNTLKELRLYALGGLRLSYPPGNYEEASQVANDLLTHQPDRMAAVWTLCVVNAHTGRMQEALRLLEQLRQREKPNEPLTFFEQCKFEVDTVTGNRSAALKLIQHWIANFPDKVSSASLIAGGFVELKDYDRASDWFERAYDRREVDLFTYVYWPQGAVYRQTAPWKALTQRPAFREWQAVHDQLAAELKAHVIRPE